MSVSERYIADHVLADASAYRHQFSNGTPFRHVVVDDFFSCDFAKRLFDEFPPFESGNARNEAGILGNKSTIEEIRELGPAYAELDELLRSRSFLDLVGNLTSIDDLLYDPHYFGAALMRAATDKIWTRMSTSTAIRSRTGTVDLT